MRDIMVTAISENAWISYLFDTTLAVSMLILLLCMVRPLMKRLPRIGMYLLWLVVAVRLLCPVTVQGLYALLPERVEAEMAQTGQKMKVSYLAERAGSVNRGGEKNHYRLSENVRYTDEEEQILPETGLKQMTDVPRTEKEEKISPSSVLVIVWAAGMAATVFLLVFSAVRTRRLLSGAKRCKDRIYTHPLVDNSFVTGFLRPRIYISERITGQDREYVLAHERVHIKRKDYLVKPLYYLLCSVYWFNPLMWLAYYLMEKDMEVSCDEAVIRNMGEEDRKQYSYLLLNLSASRRTRLGQYTAFSVGTLRDRICSVITYKKPTVAVTAVMVFVLSLAGCGAVSSPETGSTEQNVKNSNKGIYVEQMKKTEDITDHGVRYTDIGVRQVYNGQVIRIFTDKNDIPYIDILREYGDEIQPAPWIDNLQAAKKKYKNTQLTDAQMGEDGYLYITMIGGSMSEEAYGKNPDNFYYTGTYMFKIDTESGNVEEIEIPQESVKEMYEKQGITIQKGSKWEKKSADGKAMVPVMCRVCPDGQILVTDSMHVNCLYDPVQKKASMELALDLSKVDQMETGNGFFVYLERNQATKVQSVHVVSLATGEEEYSVELETEMAVDAEGGFSRNCGIGLYEDTILMADSGGIYEMDYGEKTFHKIVDTQTDNVYYLGQVGQKEYLEVIDVWKDDMGTYYVNMSDDGAFMHCKYSEKISS